MSNGLQIVTVQKLITRMTWTIYEYDGMTCKPGPVSVWLDCRVQMKTWACIYSLRNTAEESALKLHSS